MNNKEHTRLKGILKRRLKSSKKYRDKWEKQLQECLNWQFHFHTGELLQANLYKIKPKDLKICVEDWEKEGKWVEIPLSLKKSPHEVVAESFKKAKKLKKGIPFAQKEVEKGEKDVKKWEELLAQLENVQSEEELEVLRPHLPSPGEKKQKEAALPAKPYLEYLSSTGLPIWVGKSAALNDQLTFRHASGNDLWLHASEYPGSHVVIHAKEIDPKTLHEALQLALYYSKAKQGREGEVSVTQVKHVRKGGKEKGKVQIAHEKRHFIRLPSNYLPNPHRL